MVKWERFAESKLLLLRLAEELHNVSLACRLTGYSRDSYYRFRKLYRTGGKKALMPKARRSPNVKNRVPVAVETAVVLLALEHPEFGPLRASRELATRDIAISPSGIRGVLVRNNLQTYRQRQRALMALQRH